MATFTTQPQFIWDRQAISLLPSLNKTFNSIFISSMAPGLPPDLWLPPPDICVKLNFDGSFHALGQHASIGRIKRNAPGLMFTAYAGKVKAVHSVEAELQAPLSEVEIRLNLSQTIVIIGDCLILLNALASNGSLSWTFMNNWRILLNKLKQLTWWEKSFCKRNSNMVAYALSHPHPHPHPANLS